MLCSGLVCVSLSLATTYVITALLPRNEPVEPVVSPEDRLELQKDVEAALVLAALAGVLYMSYLWRTLFAAPAAEPQHTLEPLSFTNIGSDRKDNKEEKDYEDRPSRRPSEHKATQYQLSEEAQYTSVETQTTNCLLPVEWTSSDSHLSDSSLSVTAPLSDTQVEAVSSETVQQPTSGALTGGASPDYAQTSSEKPLTKMEGTHGCTVQLASEPQASKAAQTEELQDNLLVNSVALYLTVESPQRDTAAETTSQPASEPQSYATSSAKAQQDFERSTNSEKQLEAGDLSPPEADAAGLTVIREPAVQTANTAQTFTVSLTADQSPRRSTPSPRSPDRLPTPKMGSYAARRRLTCNRCLSSRPQAGGQGNTQATDGENPATVKVTASPSSPTARGGGDAPQPRLPVRQPAAGRGYRPPGKNQQAPFQSYSSLNYRPGPPCPRTPPNYVYKPPFV